MYEPAFLGIVAAVAILALLTLFRIASKVSEIRNELRPKAQAPNATPAHVVFSDQLLAVPPLPAIFDRPLWLKNPSPESFTMYRKCGDWIKEGEAVLSMVVSRPLLRDTVCADVLSPISGRLLF